MEKIEELFNEIIEEAEEGIKYNNINIEFHTLEKYSIKNSYNDGMPILIIHNKKELINKLKQYVSLVLETKKIEVNDKNIKRCIALLWANACYEDFSNPSRFIDNHINFYLNNDFMSDIKILGRIIMKRVNEPIYKETPYAFKAYVKDIEYELPTINYGISDDTCYIYSLNKPSIDNKELEDKYDVNMLSLSLLVKELYSYGISKIKVVSCMPMRLKDTNVINILDDFNTMNYLFNNIIISSNPFEMDEYMNVNISEFDGESKTNFNDILKEDSQLYEEKVI